MFKVKMGITVLMIGVAVTAFAQRSPVYIQGNWEGAFTSSDWQNHTIQAQIIGESGVDYRALVFVGEKGKQKQEGQIRGKTQKGITYFKGDMQLGPTLGGIYTFQGEIDKAGAFRGTLKSKRDGKEISFTLKRIFIKPPTLGQQPPQGAIVLMSNVGASAEEQRSLHAKQVETFYNEWNVERRWVVLGDGSIRMTPSSITTKRLFKDFQLHVEFRCPYEPNDRGQARGNSGVYLLGRYEVQVLDSYGLPTRDNHCGGIYQQAVPLENASLPPGEWQTYDITFQAPRFDGSGKKTQNARVTVKHNGKTIHDDLELKGNTPGGISNKEAPEGPLLFQDHGDYVSWRNVWIKPL